MKIAVAILGGLVLGGAAIAYLITTDRFQRAKPTPTPHPFHIEPVSEVGVNARV